MIRKSSFIFIALFFAFFSHAAYAENTIKAYTTPSKSVYAKITGSISSKPLRVGDKLYIAVFKEDDLSGTYSVDSKGNIDFPLLGVIKVEGMDAEQLRDKITALLGEDYLVNPQVKVEYQGGQNSSVSVLGQVTRPGNYVLTSEKTLLSILSEAGGLTQNASNTIQLIRLNEAGQKEMQQFDVKKILQGEQPDVILQLNDSVYVDKKDEDFEATVAVLGQVNRPGNFTFTPDLTITRAISQAQGFTRFANPSQVKISRTYPEKKSFQANVNAITDGRSDDVPLQRGDIVFVPESAF